jgi:V8-like Glu-specific endopeptidase
VSFWFCFAKEFYFSNSPCHKRAIKGAKMKRIFLLICITISSLHAQANDFTTFIFNGEPATAKQWQSVVAISYDGQFICSGVLIRRDVVLTAAHCIDGLKKPKKYFRVHLGQGTNGVYQRTFNIKQASIPRDYQGLDENDYGFMILDGFVEPSEAEPAKILSNTQQLENSLIQLDKQSKQVHQVGYGIIDDGSFGEKYASTAFYQFADESMIFLNGADSGVCAGDSGSPAFIQGADQNWFVIGLLTSSGFDINFDCGSLSNYVRIDKAYQFYLDKYVDTYRYRRTQDYLKQISFGVQNPRSSAWRYRKAKGLNIQVDDRPFKQGYPYFYLSIGYTEPIKMRVYFDRMQYEAKSKSQIEDEFEEEGKVQHRVLIQRVSSMPSNSKDQNLFRQVFDCHKEKKWNKCLSQFRGRFEYLDSPRTKFKLMDAHCWMADQLSLRW